MPVIAPAPRLLSDEEEDGESGPGVAEQSSRSTSENVTVEALAFLSQEDTSIFNLALC